MPVTSHYLLIDISNSMTKIAPSGMAEIEADPLLIPTADITPAVLEDLPWKLREEGSPVILSSVVPDKSKVVEAVFGQDRVLGVSSSIELGIGIDYPTPETIGADRLAMDQGPDERLGSGDLGAALRPGRA